MKAERLFYQRIDYDDGSMVEISLWRLPTPVPPSAHGLKYSLFYGRPGIRQIGYDNERGKGDHRHIEDREEPYLFESWETLIDDFLADVARVRSKAP